LRHAVDLIEKERAAARVLDFAGPRFHRAGECACLVTEELALDHGFRNRRAIDRDIVTLLALAEIMQTARDQVFADARLAVKDDAHIGAGEFADGRAQIFRGLRCPDDARCKRLVVDGAAQPPVLDDELALLARVPHDFEKPLRNERLLDEIIGAEAHRLDRRLYIAVTGDHHDGKLGIGFLRATQQREPVHALHLEVGHHDARKGGAELRRGGACGLMNHSSKPASSSHCVTA
jgi:hypothetical protein